MNHGTIARSVCVAAIVGTAVSIATLSEHASPRAPIPALEALASESERSRSPHLLERGTHFSGTPVRVICVDAFPIGDTVSITLGQAGGFDISAPAWINGFRGRLRRTLQGPFGADTTRMQFILERVEGRGSEYTGALGEVATDVESTTYVPGHRGECIGPQAVGPRFGPLFGTVLRTLRFW